MTRVDEVLESIAVWDFKNSIQKELKRYPHNDPLKLKKLKVMSDRINSLSDNEYEHHVYCQRASFYGYATKQRALVKMQADLSDSSNFPLKNQKMEKYGFVKRKVKVDRFLEFLRGGEKNKIQLSEVVVEALICLANELVLKLVSNAAKHRFQFSSDESILPGPLRVCDIEATYASLCDQSNVPRLSLIKNSKPAKNQSIYLTASF
jgi:hypothetical protein